MTKTKFLLPFALLFPILAYSIMPPSTNFYSITTDGNWKSGADWSSTSGGTSCACTPSFNTTDANDVITIETNMILNDILDVSSNTTIVVKAGVVLEVNGDVTFRNGSVFTVEASATLRIVGNLDNRNNSDDITIDGLIDLDGNFTGGNGSEINGTGAMNVTGSAITTGTGMIFGSMGDCPVGPCNSSFAAPLPVELLYFNAIANGDKVEITWGTSSEINNDFFTLERSRDGTEWEEFMKINGAGNSTSTINYFEIDPNPYEGLSFYRLRQVDYNGADEYFNVVPVQFEIINGESVGVFPNPIEGGETLNLQLKGLENKEVLVVLRDIKGEEIYSSLQLVESENELLGVDKTNSLAPGVYLVMASTSNSIYSKKVVIK